LNYVAGTICPKINGRSGFTFSRDRISLNSSNP